MKRSRSHRRPLVGFGRYNTTVVVRVARVETVVTRRHVWIKRIVVHVEDDVGARDGRPVLQLLVLPVSVVVQSSQEIAPLSLASSVEPESDQQERHKEKEAEESDENVVAAIVGRFDGLGDQVGVRGYRRVGDVDGDSGRIRGYARWH